MKRPHDYTIQVRGKLVMLSQPLVMGILNATPDSFYAASRMQTEDAVARRSDEIVSQGGTMIDVGACSTRPDSVPVDMHEEMRRLRIALSVVRREHPDVIVSVDTFRPEVARMVVEDYGVDIINDVSEGRGEKYSDISADNAENIPEMFKVVADLGVPYVLTSVQPDLRSMLLCFSREIAQLHSLGQKDVILDPGFGFGKTLEQNYALMGELEKLHVLGLPLLVGISRKSMIYRLLGIEPSEALNGTTVLNTLSLVKGASILRVHDVRAAIEAVKIICETKK